MGCAGPLAPWMAPSSPQGRVYGASCAAHPDRPNAQCQSTDSRLYPRPAKRGPAVRWNPSFHRGIGARALLGLPSALPTPPPLPCPLPLPPHRVAGSSPATSMASSAWSSTTSPSSASSPWPWSGSSSSPPTWCSAACSRHGLRRAGRQPAVHADGASAGCAYRPRRCHRHAARPGCSHQHRHGPAGARPGLHRLQAAGHGSACRRHRHLAAGHGRAGHHGRAQVRAVVLRRSSHPRCRVRRCWAPLPASRWC